MYALKHKKLWPKIENTQFKQIDFRNQIQMSKMSCVFCKEIRDEMKILDPGTLDHQNSKHEKIIRLMFLFT